MKGVTGREPSLDSITRLTERSRTDLVHVGASWARTLAARRVKLRGSGSIQSGAGATCPFQIVTEG